MSRNATLANAARRVRAANLRLPEQHRLDLADEWRELLRYIDGMPDLRAIQAVEEWTLDAETRMSSVLLNAPLLSPER